MFLQKIQKLTSGGFAWLFAFLIAISCVLWGVETRFFTGSNLQTDYATVNGETISMIEVERVLQTLRDNFYAQNQQMTPSELIDNQLRANAFNQIVMMKLMYQYATQNGLFASDAQMHDYISQRYFGSNKIDPALLEQFISKQAYKNKKDFHDRLIMEYTSAQVQHGFYASEFLTEYELDQWLLLLKQERDVSILRIESEHCKAVNVTEEDVKQYYEANKEKFKKPERVSIEYIEFSNEDVKKNIQVSEEEALEYYETQKNHFSETAQWKLAHILIRTDNFDQAKETAEKLYQQLKKGADFKALAKKYSADTLTSTNGGELAWLTTSLLKPKIVAALNKLPYKEKLLEPIEVSSGFEIFKVLDVKPELLQPFEVVRAEIIELLKKKRVTRVMADFTEQLADLTFSNPDSLISAADTFGLALKSTEKFAINQSKAEGILSYEKVRQVAFSPDVLLDRNNSDIIPLTQDLAVVIRVKEHEPQRLLSFDEARKAATKIVTRLKQITRSKDIGEMFLDKLKFNKPIQADLQKYKLQWLDYKKVSRDSRDVMPAIKKIILKVPTDDPYKKIHGFFNQNDFTIVHVKSITDINVKDVIKKERDDCKSYLVNKYSIYAYNAYLSTLKEDATINVLTEINK